MTIETLVARAAEIDDELAALLELDELDEEQESRFNELSAEVDDLAEQRSKMEAREAARAKAAEIRKHTPDAIRETVPTIVRKPELGDVYEVRGNEAATELRDRALKAIEDKDHFEIGDDSRERVTKLIERKDDAQGTIAKRVLLTGSKAYKRAFAKVMGANGNEALALASMDEDSRNALVRAMSLTDGSGGYAVPFTLDGTLINLGDGAANPFRNVSRVETITTDAWNGLASTQMTAGYAAEASEVGDDATTFTQPNIPVHRGDAFVPASIEITQDYPGIAEDLMELFADGRNNADAAAFVTGSGTNEPTGIVTALTGGSSIVTSAATDTFAVGDVYETLEQVPPRFRGPGARLAWMSALGIYHDIRQFGSAGNPGPNVFEATNGILELPWVEGSGFDGTINATQDNYVLIVGDWRNYVIVDRVGASVEFVPHLFATGNNRPSGQRGWLYLWRSGADSVNDNAFRLLNVT